MVALPGRVARICALTNILIVDHFLGEERRERIWDYLDQPGWTHGAYSSAAPDAPRYFYKHFAGYQQARTRPAIRPRSPPNWR